MDSMEVDTNVVGCDGGCTAIVDTGLSFFKIFIKSKM
jgi:hypothetical protein